MLCTSGQKIGMQRKWSRLRTTPTNLKKNGIIGVVDFAASFVSDYLFDFRYGTSTGGWIPVSQLQINSANVEHSVRYQPTKTRPFRKLLKKLSFPDHSVFVDVGAGKGKALLIASGFGFERLTGIEFAHDLCEIAQSNIDAYRKRSGSHQRVSITSRSSSLC
jgi:hypothetical protein